MKQKIVIKLGGSSLQNPATLRELAGLVRGYLKKRYHVAIVHGGGPAINEELIKRGITWEFIDGQRRTTPEMMDVIEEVLAKDVNSQLVTSLRDAGIPALGLSGAQDRILFCVQARAELLQVGKVERVDTKIIDASFDRFPGLVPVIAPIGIGRKNMKYNVNADWAATQIAIALGAKKLVFLTDQNGILDENRALLRRANPRVIDRMIEAGIISGGMCTKVRAMTAALEAGVKQIRVLHASFASQLLIDEKIGTLLTVASEAASPTQHQRDLQHGRAS